MNNHHLLHAAAAAAAAAPTAPLHAQEEELEEHAQLEAAYLDQVDAQVDAAYLDQLLDARQLAAQVDAAHLLDTSGPEFSYLALLGQRYAGCAADMAAHLVHKVVADDGDAVATMLLVFFACRRDSDMVDEMLCCLVRAGRAPHESTLAALVELSARRRDLATLTAVDRYAAHHRPARESELRELRQFWRKEDRIIPQQDGMEEEDVLRPARIAAAADVLTALRTHGMPCPPILAAEAAAGAAVDVDEGWAYCAQEDEVTAV